MEAARTLQLTRERVDVEGDSLRIRDLTVEDRAVVELVERRRSEQAVPAEDTVLAALEIGARVLDREGRKAEVDFVKHEFERVSGEVERSFAEQAGKVGEELAEGLERFLGEEDGAVGKVLESHQDAVEELVTKHFGADRNTAVQHQLREVMEKLLAESRDALLKQFSARDGHNPLAGFQDAVTKEVERSRKVHEEMVQKLVTLEGTVRVLARAEQAAVEIAEEREHGTRKGRTFETQVFEALEPLAAARGDAASHVGDERSAAGGKKGDIVVEIDAASGPAKARIAIEVKDERLSKNDAWKVLNATLAQRDADFAILAVASEGKVPAGREALHEYEGNKMIVTFDREDPDDRALELAYRYARCRCLMAAERTLEVDAPGVRDAAGEALSALKDAQKIRSSLTGASNSVGAARGALDVMIARVEVSLERIEALITAAE